MASTWVRPQLWLCAAADAWLTCQSSYFGAVWACSYKQRTCWVLIILMLAGFLSGFILESSATWNGVHSAAALTP